MSSRKVFINLPVKSLPASITFFQALGYTFNQQFTDETATCMVISEEIYAMLLTEEKFRGFSPNPVCDAKQQNEVSIALNCDNRAEVDEIVKKAVAAGGTTYNAPTDYGFMYSHGFQDLDGHVWDYFYMDPSHVQPQG